MDFNNLYIIGAGGFGRQLESYLELVPDQKINWKLKGYIDDNPNALEGMGSSYEVLGSVDNFNFQKNDMVLLAIADIKTKIKIAEMLRGSVKFFTFVAEGALIGKNVTLQEGCIICPGAKIGSNVTLGEFCLINLDTIVGHDSIIGKNNSIMPHVDIGGGSVIGNNIFMGTKATVSPRLNIVDNTNLGVGSVIIKDIVEPGTYFGVPARRML
ncbi:NeuD/PglB/VioB family sugar acetyltransferase [Flagellimonas pelagia]|uniref:PglD N-terminal domain-containing protein n=1 Tax=Flagellimonas pelagia TaxID=2306998 RepID=A0A3A1NJU4_9FLAO|nr:NeuD/PglB/VioB family sugar acetyltransferase [Allomuricauda maritima]RIV46062.1 hypothetical protein D2V05_05715 [Allomuricauda maritima]TXJ98832.1 hypothetical protein FQ017_05670 [Allomuricauda maritima]